VAIFAVISRNCGSQVVRIVRAFSAFRAVFKFVPRWGQIKIGAFGVLLKNCDENKTTLKQKTIGRLKIKNYKFERFENFKYLGVNT
jgi:hypothetical protein